MKSSPLPKLPEFEIKFKTKQKTSELFQINSSKDVATACRACFDADSIEWVESMIVIGLSVSNKIIGFYKISQGGITGTVCDPKVVMQFALLSNSVRLVISHNHPSGSTRPSGADKELTQKIKKAAELFDILLLDHIIITDESYFSFADEGIL